MSTIFILLVGVVIGAGLAYYFWYSPKARIKNLWKIIHRYSPLLRPDLMLGESAYPELAQKIREHGEMINLLLKYNFDPEEDKEYIEQNKWLTRDEQIRG